MSTNFVGTIML